MKKILTSFLLIMIMLGVHFLYPSTLNAASGTEVCDMNNDGLITRKDLLIAGPPSPNTRCEIIYNGYYPDEHKNNNKDEYIEIFDYRDLPNTNEFNILNVKYDRTIDDVRRYDLIFNHNDDIYIFKNRTLPEVFKPNDLYEYKWIKKNDEDIQIEFINLNNNTNIIWEVITGDYIANHVIEITAKEVEKIQSSNPTLYNEYLVHFDTNIPIDDIYQIDITYNTYKNLLFFWKYDIQHHEETISKQNYSDLIETKDIWNKFGNWLQNLTGFESNQTIQPSTNKNYQWEFYLGPFPSDRFVEKVLILNLYYVTDGNYYEAPVEDEETDPPGTPPDENIITPDIIDNIKDIGIIILIIVGLVLLGPLVTLVTTLLKIIITIIKLLINGIKIIIMIPINLFNLIFSSTKNKNKYKY